MHSRAVLRCREHPMDRSEAGSGVGRAGSVEPVKERPKVPFACRAGPAADADSEDAGFGIRKDVSGGDEGRRSSARSSALPP